MSASNDTNRIEAGDLLIEKNASGEIEIHNLADGESVTIGAGGLSANAIDTENLNNEIIANAQDGTTLSAKISNALSALEGGRGQITVNPPTGGGTWDWGSDLTINPSNYAGIDLVFTGGTKIEYDAGGQSWPLTIDSGGSATNQIEGETFRLYGGIWERVNGAAEGWIRLMDVNRAVIHPRHVDNFQNSDTTSTAVSLENHGTFSENVHIYGNYRRCDIGIDTKPASVTGGSGTDSFQDTVLGNVRINARNIGIRMRGQWDDSTLLNPTVILAQDNAVGYVLDGRMEGTTLIAPEVEDPGDTQTGTIGFQTGSNYTQRAFVFGGELDHSLDTDVDASGGPIMAIQRDGTGMALGALGGTNTRFSLTGNGDVQELNNFNTGSPVGFAQGLDFPLSADLSTTSGSSTGELRKHDGSDGSTAGVYEWDGSSWHGIGAASGTTLTP